MYWAPRHQHHKPKCTSIRHYIILQRVATSWQLHGKRGATAWYDLRDFSMAHPPRRRVHPRPLPTPPQGTTLRRRGTQRFAQTRSSVVLRVFSRASRSARESHGTMDSEGRGFALKRCACPCSCHALVLSASRHDLVGSSWSEAQAYRI